MSSMRDKRVRHTQEILDTSRIKIRASRKRERRRYDNVSLEMRSLRKTSTDVRNLNEAEKKSLIVTIPLIATFLIVSYQVSAVAFYTLIYAIIINAIGFVFYEAYQFYQRRNPHVRKQQHS